MNVLNIRKQCDEKLTYTTHAIERATERSVPMPVYIPFDSVCDGKEIRDGQVVYKIVYKYKGSKFCLVVRDDMTVLTMYAISSSTILEQVQAIVMEREKMKQHQRELRQNKTYDSCRIKEGKYRHKEIEAGYKNYNRKYKKQVMYA